MSDEEVKSVVVDLETGDLIQIGDGIYRFIRITDINTSPKLIFEWAKFA